MSLFKLDGRVLKSIKELPFKLERDMQRLVEDNLEQTFNLKFICTEFQLNNLRIDTLAFDEESKSFVIIEYKRDKSFSVIDQGFSYLSLLVNNKADFILQYNECMDKSLRKNDVDWEQSRVIFMASQFNTYQRKAIEFKDLPIELWEIKKFEGNLIHFNQLKPAETSESIKTVTKDKTIQAVSREVKMYSINDHFKEGWDQSRQIFDELSERIIGIDTLIEMNPKKSYIGFKIGNRNLVNLHIYKSKIDLALLRSEPADLKDPDARVEYMKDSIKHFNQHISLYNVHSNDDIDYAIFLVKQVHAKYFQ